MARTLRDTNLGSREVRARLRIRSRPYWRLIEPGLHLGYRRLAGRPGSWCVRRYVGSQTYTVSALKGVADDYADADNETVLSFGQAQQAALAHKPQAAGPLTVRQAVEDYLAHLDGRGGTSDARIRAAARRRQGRRPDHGPAAGMARRAGQDPAAGAQRQGRAAAARRARRI